MIKLDIIKHQMAKMDISTYYLWQMTGIGYATINGILKGNRKLETVQTKNYERIIGTLFTKTERIIAEQCSWGVKQYEAFYLEAIKIALNDPDLDIQRSGAPFYEETNKPRNLPAHIILTWQFVADSQTIEKHTKAKGASYYLCSLRVFDDDIYRKMNHAGQKNKRNLIKSKVDALESPITKES